MNNSWLEFLSLCVFYWSVGSQTVTVLFGTCWLNQGVLSVFYLWLKILVWNFWACVYSVDDLDCRLFCWACIVWTIMHCHCFVSWWKILSWNFWVWSYFIDHLDYNWFVVPALSESKCTISVLFCDGNCLGGSYLNHAATFFVCYWSSSWKY